MLDPVLSRRMIQPRNANCRHSSHVEVISHQEDRVPTRDTRSPPYAYSVPVFGDHSTRLGKRVDNRPIHKGLFPKGTSFSLSTESLITEMAESPSDHDGRCGNGKDGEDWMASNSVSAPYASGRQVG